MKIKTINIEQVRESKILNTRYHMDIVPIMKKYNDLLNKKFKDCLKVPFRDLTEEISNGQVEKDDIIIKNLPNGKLAIEIAKKSQKVKSVWAKYRVCDKRVSSQYILWHFSNKEVKDFMGVHAIASVLGQIPLSIIENLVIPIPKLLIHNSTKNKVTVSTKKNAVREIIRRYYEDYQENYNANRFDTAIILAGAICEAILFEALVEVGISESILSRNKTLGTLIEYAQIKELDKIFNVNLTHFESIKQHRNKAIHIGLAIKKLENGEIIDKNAFKDFDHIIKNFGI